MHEFILTIEKRVRTSSEQDVSFCSLHSEKQWIESYTYHIYSKKGLRDCFGKQRKHSEMSMNSLIVLLKYLKNF